MKMLCHNFDLTQAHYQEVISQMYQTFTTYRQRLLFWTSTHISFEQRDEIEARANVSAHAHMHIAYSLMSMPACSI